MATDIRQTRVAEEPGTVLQGISWKTYLKLRDNPKNYHIRMSYLDGTLILMSPQFTHDKPGWRFGLVIDMVTWVHRIPRQGTGTTTLRRQGPGPKKGTGKEPDLGFYFRENDLRMRNKEDIDLEVDPPPDLAIEVDNTRDSSRALKLYARLGVPEVWRYKRKTKALWFGRLAGDHYEPIDRSLNLPMLTPALVLQALAEAERIGELEWKDWLLAGPASCPKLPRTSETRRPCDGLSRRDVPRVGGVGQLGLSLPDSSVESFRKTGFARQRAGFVLNPQIHRARCGGSSRMAEKHPTWTRTRVGRNRVHWVAYDDRSESGDRVDR